MASTRPTVWKKGSGEYLRQAAKCGRRDGCISRLGKQPFDRADLQLADEIPTSETQLRSPRPK